MPASTDQYRSIAENWDLPPFYRAAYLDLCYGPENWTGYVIEREGAPVAIWPMGEMKQWGHTRMIQHLFTPLQGPWFRDAGLARAEGPAVVRELLSGLGDFSEYQQNYHWSLGMKPGDLPPAFRGRTRPTYIIDLTVPLDELWENLKPTYRNNKIRKAEDVVELKAGVSAGDFHEVHKKTYERQGIPMFYTLDFLERWMALMEEQGWGEAFCAADADGRLHSVGYLMYGSGTAWLFMHGNDPVLRKSGSGIWLAWEMIKAAKARGAERFDFLGSSIPSIARVRKDLGGQRVDFLTVRATRGWIFPVLQGGWRFFRKKI
jgi:hypothetical protein